MFTVLSISIFAIPVDLVLGKLCAYGLAAMMTLATIIWLPLIALVALFKGDGDMIFMSLAMWFALVHEFVTEKLFG